MKVNRQILIDEGSMSSVHSWDTNSPANKPSRGSRGPEAGVRGIPPPFINLDERGRDTPHASLLPLLLMRKDFLDEGLVLGGPGGDGGADGRQRRAVVEGL